MPFRRLAKQNRFAPDKQEFQFTEGSKNPFPKPDAAKRKSRKTVKLRLPKA